MLRSTAEMLRCLCHETIGRTVLVVKVEWSSECGVFQHPSEHMQENQDHLGSACSTQPNSCHILMNKFKSFLHLMS